MQKKVIQIIQLSAGIILFLLVIYLQNAANHIDNMEGMIDQLPIIISVYLVFIGYRKGFWLAVGLNIMQAAIVCLELIWLHDYDRGHRIAIAGCTIFIITIIYKNKVKLMDNIREIAMRNTAIVDLNKKLSDQNEELRIKNEKLEYFANNDVLTELPNRKYVIQNLKNRVTAATLENKKFALVFIDIDNFKSVNDTFGHSSGDLLLKLFGVRISESIDRKDVFGRIGGDEFALIIRREMTGEALYEYMNHLRTISLEPYCDGNVTLRISISIGIAVFPEDGRSDSELYTRADDAMYCAKKTGKNGICFSSWRECKK